MFGRTLAAISVICILATSGVAQDQEKPKEPERPQPESPQPQPRQQPSRTQQPLYLTGSVVMEDGSQPEVTMRVELVCSGRVRQQAHVMTNGGFSLMAGDQNPSARFSDATVGADLTRVRRRGRAQIDIVAPGTERVDLRDCEVRLSPSPEYTANTIQLTDRGVLDNPDVGTLYIHRVDDGPGRTVSATTLAAPRRARRAFENALRDLGGKNVDKAKVIGELEEAVAEYEQFSAAWSLLGDVRLASGDWEGARDAFERSIAGDPHFVRPYLALAEMAFEREDWAEVTVWTREALDLNRTLHQGHYLHGLASFYQDRFDEAQGSFLYLRKRGLVDRYPAALLFLGIIHAGQGNIPAAAEEMQGYLELMPADRVPPEQREGIERQIAEWRREGLLEPSVVGP